MKKFSKSIVAIIIVAAMSISFVACGKSKDDKSAYETKSKETTTEEVATFNNPLTNESNFNEDMIGKRPVAIMINNAPKARPQWGLTSADAVFEFCVEGGVTRMMWLFADYNQMPDKIGPVRSARHHFVYLADSLDVIYTHWGGSIMAYDVLQKNKIDDIDAIKNSEAYFYRDKTRNVPIEHRGITDGDKLVQAIEARNIDTNLKNGEMGSPFIFTNKTQALSGGNCSQIKVSFSKDYNHTFKYNEQDKLYYNYMNDTPMTDGNNNKQMAVSNVVVLYAPTKTLSNDLCDVDLTGGKGYYISNGTYQEINWKKGNNTTSELKLTYEDGSTVKLNTGKTWFGFVPTDRSELTQISDNEVA